MKVRPAVIARIVNIAALLLALKMGVNSDLNLTSWVTMKVRKRILMCTKQKIGAAVTIANLVLTTMNLGAVVTVANLVLTTMIASNSTLVQTILQRKSKRNQRS